MNQAVRSYPLISVEALVDDALSLIGREGRVEAHDSERGRALALVCETRGIVLVHYTPFARIPPMSPYASGRSRLDIFCSSTERVFLSVSWDSPESVSVSEFAFEGGVWIDSLRESAAALSG